MSEKTTRELFDDGKQALKYKPEYAKQLLDHLKGGKDFECFNVTPRVARSTIRQWVHDHEDFRLAKEEGEDSFQGLIEKMIYNKLIGNEKNFMEKLSAELKVKLGNMDIDLAKFLLTKRFRRTYADRVDNVLQNPDGSKIQQSSGIPQIDLKKLSIKELKALKDIYEKAKPDEPK